MLYEVITIVRRPVEDRRFAKTRETLEGRVHGDDPVLRVENRHALAGAGENHGGASQALFLLAFGGHIADHASYNFV